GRRHRATRRHRLLNPDRRHPRRRRRQGRPLHARARAGALRPRAPLRARQAVGQGLARPQPARARHRALGRGAHARARADRRARRQEARDRPRRSALRDRGRARAPRAAARAHRVVSRARLVLGAARGGGRGLAARAEQRRQGQRRRRLRRLHARARQGREALRPAAAAARRLPGAHPARRPHQRARADRHHLAGRGRRRRHLRDPRRRLRPARRRRARDREDAERAGDEDGEVIRRIAPFAIAVALAACARTPAPAAEPRFQPTASVLEVVAVLRRHVPDDTYRFEPARDFTGRNVYRASLIRLENLERVHADALRAGHLDDVIAFAKGRALERLRAYDLAAEQYRRAAEREGELRAEALRSAALCDAPAEAAALGYEPDRPLPSGAPRPAPPADAEAAIAAFDERVARLEAVERESGGAHYAFVAREEIERADRARAHWFVARRKLDPDGDLRA